MADSGSVVSVWKAPRGVPSFRAPSGYSTATLAPSKGRLMRCTVDGLRADAAMKRQGFPNLQRVPAKPALGKGRIQRAVRRAFYFGSEVTGLSPPPAFADTGAPAQRAPSAADDGRSDPEDTTPQCLAVALAGEAVLKFREKRVMTSRRINAAGRFYLHAGQQRRGTLGPLNPLRSVGLLLLRGNDVPAKLGRFPNGNVAAPETPKVCLGNPIKVDAVHAGGDPCRFGAPVIKQHGDDRRLVQALNGLEATCSPGTGKTHQRAFPESWADRSQGCQSAVAALAQAEGRLPATITRVERFGETRRLPGITDAVETVEANPSHQVNHAIA